MIHYYVKEINYFTKTILLKEHVHCHKINLK